MVQQPWIEPWPPVLQVLSEDFYVGRWSAPWPTPNPEDQEVSVFVALPGNRAAQLYP